MPAKPKKRQNKPSTKKSSVSGTGINKGNKSEKQRTGGGASGAVRGFNKRARANQQKDPIQKEFSKFRHEIYKFGLEGLDKKDRIDARYELAIKLGAKPKSWIKPHKNLAERAAEKKQLKDSKPTTADNHHGKTG